jgi:carboxyl-terminal processing protease
LHQGDVLLRLKLSGEAIKDLSEADLEEVENILRGFNGKDAAITIMQANHQIKTVTLAKEKLRVDENVIKSYILQGEKRIGYIALPDFYRQTGAGTAMGCANDVAKEILKISKENIDGLLLDLRYNGGGDMQEALDLAGLFIDEGPLCVVSDGKSKPEVLKDSHRGKVYDGPLALLVNGMSASASELLACALQDYNRAVIVGATTYGKGSYQVVMPLDTLYNSALKSKEKSDPGYLKITLGKFYRVTGRSHQKKGVVPDVILPDMIDLYDLKEGNEKYALNSDSIQKKIYYHPMEALPVKELAHRSGLRLATDKNFKALTVIHDSIQKEMKLEHKVPIHIDAYKKFEKQADARRKVEERLEKDSTSAFTVLNNSYDAEIFKIDTYRKEINDAVLKNIKEDLYIDETLKIVKDLIEIHTKK